jgi:hypothetical protein
MENAIQHHVATERLTQAKPVMTAIKSTTTDATSFVRKSKMDLHVIKLAQFLL